MVTTMSMDHSQVFSEPYWRPLEFIPFLLSIQLISVLLWNRAPKSIAQARSLSPTAIAIFVALAGSLGFTWISMFLVFGIGTSLGLGSCEFVYWLCIFGYGIAKFSVIFFLIERARVVRASRLPRLQDRQYLLNCAMASVSIVVLGIMIKLRRIELRPSDNECVIGQSDGRPAGAVLAVNVALELYYSALFAVPLYRGTWSNPQLKRLATKSVMISLLSMAASTVNLVLFASHDGHELSWVCLIACTLDTTFCAVVLCLFTGGRDDEVSSSNGSRGTDSTGGGGGGRAGGGARVPTLSMDPDMVAARSTMEKRASKALVMSRGGAIVDLDYEVGRRDHDLIDEEEGSEEGREEEGQGEEEVKKLAAEEE